MPNPAELTPSAVTSPDAELRVAEILEDATEEGQEVKCIGPSGPLRATDPMPWTPYEVQDVGVFYPKKGDRAVLGFPIDGPPVILEWWPSTTEPDRADGGSGSASKDLLDNGIGMVIGTGPRLANFARTWFVSPEEPSEFEEYDLWTKPE